MGTYDGPKYRAALAGIGNIRPQFVTPPPEFWPWLIAHDIPAELCEFLFANAIAEEVPFECGSGGMWTPTDIMLLNDQESAILAAGLFAVGNTTDGDFIVIDLAEGVDGAGFVSHDELWERTAAPIKVREIYAPVDRSLHELLVGMTGEHARWQLDSHDGARSRMIYPADACSVWEMNWIKPG